MNVFATLKTVFFEANSCQLLFPPTERRAVTSYPPSTD